MRLGGRVQAAIEVLDDIETRKRPAASALKDWGLAHRFAGSGDRAAIGNLVYDALRSKKSLAYLSGSDKSSDLVFSLLINGWKMSVEEIRETFEGDKFAPEFLTDEQLAAMAEQDLAVAPMDVQADIPEWCVPSFEANFDQDWIAEAQAFAKRPSLDMRVNTLKSTREKVLKQLKNAKPSGIARNGMRITSDAPFARQPNIQAEEAYQKGRFEIQDEGSQIVADLVFARAGEAVLDFCAGAGGKTLALSAMMENKGQVHAYDADKARLAPIYERLKRAGTRNVQVHSPDDDLSALAGKMDKVVVDAPCTGTPSCRRKMKTKFMHSWKTILSLNLFLQARFGKICLAMIKRPLGHQT